MKVLINSDYNTQFKAKPSAAQMKQYTRAVSEGLNVLDKHLGIIIHNSSVPAEKNLNTGIGSLLSRNAEAAFVPFLRSHGFTSIQQDPDNIRGTFCPSPYSPMSLAKNILMFPIEKFATKEYDNLLEFSKIPSKKHSDKVDYPTVSRDYDLAFRTAYNNFKQRKTGELANEFQSFRSKNYDDLEPAAMYEILSRKNNNENWKTWNEAERNLYDSPDKKLLKELKDQNKDEIDFYIFKQWLVQKEIAKANERNEKTGMRVLGDSPIAFTPTEEWLNKDLFLDDVALGCPPDDFAKNGQRWNFAVLKPETIFNADGTLGKGGELMKKRYEMMFDASRGGARIDHVIGLIDPFVYTPSEPVMTYQNSGRLYSSPNHPKFGKYLKSTDEQYAAILEKIVFPAAAKFGLTKQDIICEDLGTVTPPVMRVIDKLKLSGIAVTQYDYRGRDVAPDKVIMPGSHDNISFIEYTNKLFTNEEGHHRWIKTGKLAEDIAAPAQNREEYHHRIHNNKIDFMKAAFAELFTSPAKKVQIFFTDLFGIGKTYNRPGTIEGCWELRLNSDYEKTYYDNVKTGTAPNIPECIATAIRAKGNWFAERHKALLEKLDEFSKILNS